jgi:hypothetical protein
VPPATRGSGSPGRAGRNSPHLQKSGFRGLFHFLPWNQVPEGQGCPSVTGGSLYLVWTFAVPGVDPRCTLGVISAGPGRARPTHGGGLQTVFTFTRGTGQGGRGRLRLARGRGSGPGTPRWRPWSAESMSAAGAVCAREGALPGERAVALATARQAKGRHGNLPGTGSPATGRPVPGQSVQPACVGLSRCRRGRPSAGFRGWGRERSAELADRLAGFANLRPFHVVS